MHKKDLLTPALILDLDMFEANVHRMASHAAVSGKRLRPHAKAHKCVEIARRQVDAGAVGVCVATVQEMAWMARHSIPGILLTCPIATAAKAEHVVPLAGHAPDLTIVIDHPQQVELWQKYAAMASWNLQVLVDLDVGDHRTGMPCDERAIELAKQIHRSPNLELRGVQAYSVSGSHTDGFEARRQHSLTSLAPAIQIFEEMRRVGLPVEIFSGGSTGTWNIDTAIPEFTELQAGSYVGMDIAYRRIGVDFLPALSVAATVISANHSNRVTIDAGFKAFSTDRPFGPEPRALPGVRYQWAGDEHGFLLGDVASLRLGDMVDLDPPHCDPTFNLYDRVYACRGDQVEHIWMLKGVDTMRS
ncbi:MAG: DSD1 family PLP-dependent enzyme [Bryobacterales bacterium]|nr:DSD1 family PLP-dependent enzyme [Bryobacterales bacterium]